MSNEPNTPRENEGKDLVDAFQHEKVPGSPHTTPQGSSGLEVESGHLSDHKAYKDLNFKAIFQFMVGLLVMVVFSYVAMWGVMEGLAMVREETSEPVSPMAERNWDRSGPQLQNAPRIEWTRYLMAQDSVLSGASGGVSIDQAIDEVVGAGLPYRESTAEEPGAADTAAPLVEEQAAAIDDTTLIESQDQGE